MVAHTILLRLITATTSETVTLHLYQNAVRIGEVSESTIYSTGLKREQTYKQIQYN